MSAEDAPIRHRIVEAAGELFGHYGYGKTGVGDIARCCGMSPANLYRYFRGKQQIGEEVVRCWMHETEAAMAEASASGPAEARIRAAIHAASARVLEEMREGVHMIELALMIQDSDSGVLAAHVAWTHERVAAMLAEGHATGELVVPDPQATAPALVDCARAFLMPTALAAFEPANVPGRIDAALDLAFRGLRAG